MNMDNPETVIVNDSLIEKVVHKRRSSVFKRQSIVAQNQDLNNISTNETINQESIEFDKITPLSFDIEKYIKSINEEDRKWHEVYARRKSRVQDLIKRDKKQEQVKQTLDITILSDCEKEFLASKPDYKEFNKNIFELHEMATKVTFLNLCAKNFFESTVSKLQEDTDSIVNRIINLID